MRILYKYVKPGPSDNPLPVELRTRSFIASDPRAFNDPFEVRPWFDQERHKYFTRGHEEFYRRVGIEHSLVADGSLADTSVEDVVGFGEELNKRFRDDLGERFRILCLSRNSTNILMWGHYTYSYRGAVVGIDVEDPAFPVGMRSDGFAIEYSHDRSRTRLPLAYYQFPPVEKRDIHGTILNDPNEQVISDAGLSIPFSVYLEQVEDARMRAITAKADSCRYEEEVRFIYELPAHSGQLRQTSGVSVVPLPVTSIKEIIVGFRASIPMVEQIVTEHEKGAFGEATLHYTTCHPHLFEVQCHESTPKYLLDYFKVILPSQS
jgi:hypothetical protein